MRSESLSDSYEYQRQMNEGYRERESKKFVYPKSGLNLEQMVKGIFNIPTTRGLNGVTDYEIREEL